METEAQTKQWWYESDGERKGPVTEATIRQLIQNGSLKRDNLVWSENLEAWMPIHTTSFTEHIRKDVPPPITGEAVNNTIVWWLAFAPLLGAFVQGFLAGATSSGYHQYWFVTIIINIALSYADDKKLKKAGYNTSKLGSAWLVPVYLYRRAEMLKQSPAYFWVWLILFILGTIG